MPEQLAEVVKGSDRMRYAYDYIERDGKLLMTKSAQEKLQALAVPFGLSGATGDAVESGGLVLPCSTPVAPETNTTEIPADFTTGLADINAGRIVDMDVALTQPLPKSLTLTVKSKPQNPRMLIATGDGGDKRVEVGNSENFIVGMKLQAIPHPREPAFYRLVGLPPRFKGRW